MIEHSSFCHDWKPSAKYFFLSCGYVYKGYCLESLKNSEELPIVNWTILLKLHHSTATDVPWGISKLLKLLQREVLDVSMIDLTKCETMLNSWQLSIEGAWTTMSKWTGSLQLAVSHFQWNIYHLLSTKAW